MLDVLDKCIVVEVRELTGRTQRVFPKTIKAHLNLDLSERQVRRRMARLAETGHLERVRQRMGYRPSS